jgi:hypothetical protein
VLVIEPADDEVLRSWFPRVENAGYVASDGSIVWLLDRSGAAPPQNQSPPSDPTDDAGDAPAADPGG